MLLSDQGPEYVRSAVTISTPVNTLVTASCISFVTRVIVLGKAVVWAVAPLTLAADVDTPGVSLGGAPGLHITH